MPRKSTSSDDDNVKCPLCGSKVGRHKISVTELNLDFLWQCSADGIIDEALTLLRIICEKVPGIKLDVSNKSALEEYLKKIQEQVANTLAPIDLLVKNANELLDRLSGLTEKVPSDIKNEFMRVNKELTEKLKEMEKNATETPLAIFNGALNPLMEKLGELVEKLPKNIREEFKEVNANLRQKLEDIKKVAEKSNGAVNDQVKELNEKISKLINKPTVRGGVGHNILVESWEDRFSQDKLDEKGGPGESDILIIPYLQMNGGGYGLPIAVERKSGSQKYSGKHLEEAIKHARKEGAAQVMLVYDSCANLPRSYRPLKVLFRPQEGMTVAITDLDSGSWVTAREVLEVFQIIDPPEEEPNNEIDLAEINRTVDEMQSLNTQIEKLRTYNNRAINNCEKTRDIITKLEASILAYQRRLRDLLGGRRNNDSTDPTKR